jgi:hypothetical protein
MVSKTKEFRLTVYTNVDWASSVDDRKSTSGGSFFLGECLASWLCKKNPSISLSTTKAKYIVASSCYTKVIWMKQSLKDIQVKYNHSIILNYDNMNAIHLSKNHGMHS